MKRVLVLVTAAVLWTAQQAGAMQDPPGNGLTKLTIAGSIKTHAPGHFVLDRGDHGKDSYVLSVVIDGHPIDLRADPVPENTEDPARRDAEFGEGMRYRFERTIYVAPGKHEVTILIPEDGVAVTKTVDVPKRETRLDIQPVYGRTQDRPGYNGDTHFLRGVSDVKVRVNETPL